ncbi:hypothetical protein KCU62_g8326, partial [Aureobasidium sp. EXF-3399]
MQNSPLSRLLLEIHEQIMDYIIPLEIRQMDDSMKKNVIQIVDPADKLLLMLARRHGFAATCHEAQVLSLRHHLRHTEIIWNLGEATSDLYQASIPFTSLQFLHVRGVLVSIRGVGAIQTDNFLPDICKWVDEPYKLVGVFEKALLAARSLRREQHQKELKHHQMFYTHIYSCLSYTDGNALRPIKKALRRTWKRDTIDVRIDMLDAATSLKRLEKAFALLDIEHAEKIQAIEIEVKRQEESSLRNGNRIYRDEHTAYEMTLDYMTTMYDFWKQRVRIFHERLIPVVMSGYRIDCSDLDVGLELVRNFFEPMPYRSHTGRRVANAVVDMVNSTEVHGDEPSLQMERKGG